MAMKGSCNCGKVTVTIDEVPESSLVCHCYNCRKSCGSVFSTNFVVPHGKWHIEGEVKGYSDPNTDSGNVTTRYFCPNCGSPVRTQSPARTQATIIKAGLFQNIPPPVREVFYKKNALKWEKPQDGAEVLS